MPSENKGESTDVPLENATFGVTDEADITWLSTRITAQPLRSFEEPVRLSDPAALTLPRSYILCRKEGPSLFPAFAEQAQRDGWGYYELMTSHDAMITVPEELADILVKVASG